MSLSAPADMDEPTDTETVESSPNPSESDGEDEDVDESADRPAEETMVEVDGEEVPLAEAVERNREAIDNPANHGLIPLRELARMMGRIVDLEEEVDALYGMDGQQQRQIDELREISEQIVEKMTGVRGPIEWDHFDESDGNGPDTEESGDGESGDPPSPASVME